MALFLETTAGARYFIDSGQTLTLGRGELADISSPSDSSLSPLHCSIECGDQACVVRDLDSATGTFVNGQRITMAALRAGDFLTAGSLRLTPVAQTAHATDTPSFLQYFRSLPGPLFCLLDAACGPEVFQLIASAAPARVQCLYDGASARDLAAFAPYVVQLAPDSALLTILLEKGWGKGWASYFVSRSSFEDLRHHFRKFLLLKIDNGEEVYFRFYDPRVIRIFLPTCNASELADFFGPVDAFMVESQDRATMLHLTKGQGLVSKEIGALSRVS